jgi:hypothetical protein
MTKTSENILSTTYKHLHEVSLISPFNINEWDENSFKFLKQNEISLEHTKEN